MDVCIYIPDGERIAQMTYNPRLGIVGTQGFEMSYLIDFLLFR